MSTWFIAFCGTRTGVFCTTVVLGELTGGDRQAVAAQMVAKDAMTMRKRLIMRTIVSCKTTHSKSAVAHLLSRRKDEELRCPAW
jgi:hypothetical protein